MLMQTPVCRQLMAPQLSWAVGCKTGAMGGSVDGARWATPQIMVLSSRWFFHPDGSFIQMAAQCTGGGVLGRRMVGGRVWLSDSDYGSGQIQGNYGHEKGRFAVDGGQEWMIARCNRTDRSCNRGPVRIVANLHAVKDTDRAV